MLLFKSHFVSSIDELSIKKIVENFTRLTTLLSWSNYKFLPNRIHFIFLINTLLVRSFPLHNITKTEIAFMEVHHHPEIEKKNFKQYFLEFLMIFLAVTMGFFAEQIRENISEDSQAKALAQTLYQETYADSVTMQYRLSLRKEKENQMNYFRNYVKDSNLVNLSVKFYPSFFWSCVVSSAIQFIPNDGILNQLRNSGSLRYFKNINVQKAISRMNVVILNLRTRNSQEDA